MISLIAFVYQMFFPESHSGTGDRCEVAVLEQSIWFGREPLQN